MRDSNPIRVALVAPTLEILGGQAVQAQRLLDGWRDDPLVDVWLVPINPSPPSLLSHLARIKYLRTVITQLCYWPLLFRELRKADVVHVFSASYASFLLSPLPAILIARLYGKAVIVNYRSGEAPDHLQRSWLARLVLRSTDLNVVPSSFLRDVFTRFRIRAHIVPNVADLGRFRYSVREPVRPRLLSTRNFEPLYNVACTLRVFARVQARHPDASLTLVGSGSQEDSLRRLADQLGLRNVTFAGRVPHDQIHRYYADADIYVQTPSIDNMPGSLVEAFASGLPVVSTRVGGVSVMLEHGVQGLLAPDDDDAAVAVHVMRLLEDQELARRLAATAVTTCDGYRWSLVREQWLAVYRAVPATDGRGVVSAEAA